MYYSAADVFISSAGEPLQPRTAPADEWRRYEDITFIGLESVLRALKKKARCRRLLARFARRTPLNYLGLKTFCR